MSVLAHDVEPADRDRIEQFYTNEAALLTARRYREWLELLTPDVTYQVPVRENRAPDQGPAISAESYHFDETHRTIEMRVQRFEGPVAWAENPPSRMRYFFTNIRASSLDNNGQFAVIGDLLFTRLHGSDPDYEMLTGERHDLLVDSEGEIKLARRLVLLDNVSLPTHNLAFFL